MRVWVAVGLVAAVGCSSMRSGAPSAPPPPPAAVAYPPPLRVSATQVPPTRTEPQPEPEDPLALVAECLGRGDPAAACEHLERYVGAHPDQLMYRAHLAELLLKADRPERAKAHFERFAADAQDVTGPAKAHLVQCHTRLMELAQRADDRFGEVFHRGVGLLLIVEQQASGDMDDEAIEAVLCKAVKALAEAKELRPTDARARFYLAEAYRLIGNRRAADAERSAARNLVLPDALTAAEHRRLSLSEK